MISKLRNKWIKLANDLNQANIKNPILKKITTYTSWYMLNTYIFMATMATISFTLFAISFLIEDDNIIGDYVFLAALLSFSPIVLLGVVGVVYVSIYLPVSVIINKIK